MLLIVLFVDNSVRVYFDTGLSCSLIDQILIEFKFFHYMHILLLNISNLDFKISEIGNPIQEERIKILMKMNYT